MSHRGAWQGRHKRTVPQEQFEATHAIRWLAVETRLSGDHDRPALAAAVAACARVGVPISEVRAELASYEHTTRGS